MAHQLYVLQTLSLGLLEHRMNTKMDPQVILGSLIFPLNRPHPKMNLIVKNLLCTKVQMFTLDVAEDTSCLLYTRL